MTTLRHASSKPAEDGIDQVWVEYKRSGDTELRDRLLMQYAPLVKYVAGRVRSGLPQTVDQNDLISEGVIGLMDAISKFDLERGLQFQTYAVPRIKGAIIDALRAADWVPRSARNKIKAAEQAHVELVNRLGRTPSDEEVAAELNISVAALRDLYAKVSYTNLAAVDDLAIADNAAPRPGEALEDEEMRHALLRAVHGLRERDRIIIALYYYEGFTLAEIGRVLQVTESRVSQLHTRATLALRALLTAPQVA